MSLKTEKTEKPTPLGDRVYRKHRSMLRDIATHRECSAAEALRRMIEKEHARIRRD